MRVSIMRFSDYHPHLLAFAWAGSDLPMSEGLEEDVLKMTSPAVEVSPPSRPSPIKGEGGSCPLPNPPPSEGEGLFVPTPINPSRVKGLVKRVAAALREHGLEGKRLLVAVSGGPDSLALLHALHGLSGEHNLTLFGAHLNHKLRGAESEADAEFVGDTFQGLGIPFTVDGVDVAAYRRRHKLSLEDAARRVRYSFLADAAAKHGADAIALGHTADDQAETVLMHIIRGSGLDGLRGMQALDRRMIGGRRVALFRPLLDVSRAETEGYCRALRLTPRIDPSNSSPEFLRNRIRLELVPLLEQLNPSVGDALARLARNATQDSDYIREHADAVWREVARLAENGVVRLDAAALGGEHAAIRGRVLRRAIEEAGGEVTQRHILDTMALLGGAPGKRLHLSGGLGFVTGYGEAYVGRVDVVEDALMPLPALRGSFLSLCRVRFLWMVGG